MIHIIRVRLALRLLARGVLINFTLFAGAIACHVARLLFTTPKSLTTIDWLAIPAVLSLGWLVFRLGSQLFKSPADVDHDGFLSTFSFGVFSAVGIRALWIFMIFSIALVAGIILGLDPRFDGRPHFQSYWSSTEPNSEAEAPQKHGTIYIAPPVSPAPAAKPATPAHQ